MAQRDSRTKRQSWKDNPLIGSSDAALVQAVAPVLDWARLQKNIINKFNDKGRPDHVVEWTDFQCIIVMDGSRSRKQTASGDRSDVRFKVMYLKPTKLQIGDIIYHETFGMMKIDGFDGLTNLGLTTATAVGLGGGESVEDGEAIRNEPFTIL